MSDALETFEDENKVLKEKIQRLKEKNLVQEEAIVEFEARLDEHQPQNQWAARTPWGMTLSNGPLNQSK